MKSQSQIPVVINYEQEKMKISINLFLSALSSSYAQWYPVSLCKQYKNLEIYRYKLRQLTTALVQTMDQELLVWNRK